MIAAKLAMKYPGRFEGVIMEAIHYYRDKPRSLEFFETMVRAPETLGERVTATLAEDHGADGWKQPVFLNGQAWLEIRASAAHPKDDLYGGRLGTISDPCVFIHGARDPRTEPDELAAIESHLPGRVRLIAEGGHSPHSESAAAAECSRLAREFLG